MNFRFVTLMLFTSWWMVFSSSQALSGPKTLIKYKGGKPVPGLAKSWKKVKDGQYRFDLDGKAKVKGEAVTQQLVKDTLESKLGATMGVKVAPEGKSAVLVSYNGAEDKFLKKISTTKIRAKKAVTLALEGSVSDGGIRAKSADRPPKVGEVKAIVVAVKGEVATAKVNATKSPKVKGGVLKVKTQGVAVKPNQKIFFMPDTLEGGVWKAMDKSFQAVK
jgi:hypothetical protein